MVVPKNLDASPGVADASGRLAGRVALVTGSGRNIGRAIALRFAAEGADVVVNSRTNRDEAEAVAGAVRALGRRALVQVADVGDRGAIRAMVSAAVAELGRIDILVNAAAIRPHTPFLELDEALWSDVRGVVLDGAIHCTQAVLPSMIEHHGGSVLFVVGDGAWGGGARRGHIGAAKMALIGLCRSLATEFAPHGVRFNTVSPGRIDTVRDPGSPLAGGIDTSDIPLGRLGDVDDVASACLFLVSDEAAFITGQTLHVNGGQSFH
jgi:3-oxoacyl-[acyl-carrier protein] reductase